MQIKTNNINTIRTIKTLDGHTEGEPLRIVISGYPEIKGASMLEKRQYVSDNFDQYRQFLMYEPRGHADMYGAILTEPCSKDAMFGILFMHNEGYSSMCGHAIIASVSMLIETDTIAMPKPGQCIKIDTPAGLISAYAYHDEQQKLKVSFDNVPAFVEALAQTITVADIGKVNYDIAFGGAYYAFVDADELGISCSRNNTAQLIDFGRKIKLAIIARDTLNTHNSINHPEAKDLSFLYGVIFHSGDTISAEAHSKHVCIFADGELDRSPTGTGVSARAALLQAKEGLNLDQTIIESIVGGKMTVEIVQQCQYYDKSAVIPRVSGQAFITGIHEFVLTPDDIFKNGFLLR
ncbi:proline racemase family protein [Thalassotalea sp. ND16A]|uniref:proline racemase family protein n=1 Tax=Thalassotalea sp. ND16A TaxID=1535422 RepID=UPI00051A002C|nr:proline racemase family protein [Thalassotalea sp. ND16A]KGJ98691.1 Proline racemase [Thalassotalea sp. ND16A]